MVTAVLVPILILVGTWIYWLKGRLVLVEVVGPSMLPCLAPGKRLLANRASVQPRAGQIVVVRRPHEDFPSLEENRSPWIIKRVAATAGAAVRPEWLPEQLRDHVVTVPAGMLVLLGDNAAASCDSRHVGFYPVDTVLGVVVRRL